jgi:hypothetical protein
MGRFLLALSILLVFVGATGFCQSDSFTLEITPELRAEIKKIVAEALNEELQNMVKPQPVPVQVRPAPNPNISINARNIAPRQNQLTELGQSSQRDIIDLIALKNRQISRWEIADIVKIYFDEAASERINHDIAIAQMLHATEYLTNIERTAVHNYSGMLNASFRNRATGIRAHIQHLKFYAEGALESKNTIVVDPRYSVLKARQYLGTVRTLEDLCRKWSESPGYLSSIRSKLDEIKPISRR